MYFSCVFPSESTSFQFHFNAVHLPPSRLLNRSPLLCIHSLHSVEKILEYIINCISWRCFGFFGSLQTTILYITASPWTDVPFDYLSVMSPLIMMINLLAPLTLQQLGEGRRTWLSVFLSFPPSSSILNDRFCQLYCRPVRRHVRPPCRRCYNHPVGVVAAVTRTWSQAGFPPTNMASCVCRIRQLSSRYYYRNLKPRPLWWCMSILPLHYLCQTWLDDALQTCSFEACIIITASIY